MSPRPLSPSPSSTSRHVSPPRRRAGLPIAHHGARAAPSIVALVVALVAALLGSACAAPTDARETGGSTQPLAFNETVERVLAPGDTLRFVIERVPADPPFALLLQVVTGSVHATIADSVGRVVATIAATADGRPLGARGVTPFTVPGYLGRFVVAVSGSGRVRLQAYLADRAPEIAGRTIAVGDTVSRETLFAGTDVDDFTFEGRAGEEYVAFVQTTDAVRVGRAWLAVLRPGTEDAMTTAISATSAERLQDGITTARLVLATGGPHVLRVSPLRDLEGGPYTGPYRIALLRVDPRPEGVAAEVRRAPRTIEEAIDPVADVDEYPITASAGDEYNVFLQAFGADSGAPLRVHVDGLPDGRDDPWRLGSDRRDTLALGISTGRFALPASGRATLRVLAGPERRARGRYRLTVYPVDRRPETAAPVLAPGDSVLTERIEQQGDVDEFTVDVRDSTHVNLITELAPDAGPWVRGLAVAITRAAPPAPPVPPVVEARGTVPIGSPEPVQFVTGATVLAPGRHTIVVSTGNFPTTPLVGGHSVGPYRLWLRTFLPEPETRPAAFALGERVSESADPVGDVDEFTTGGEGGDDLQLLARALDARGRCDGFLFRVWRRDGIQWLPTADVFAPADATDGVRSPRFTRDGAPPLRVDVTRGVRRPTDDCGAYEFTLVRYPTAPERSRAAIALGDEVTERMDEPGDIDEFTVHAAPGAMVVLETWSGDRPGAIDAALVDPETRGELAVAGSGEAVGVSRPVRVPASGRLLVRVAERSHRNPVEWRWVGSYRLRVVAVPAP